MSLAESTHPELEGLLLPHILQAAMLSAVQVCVGGGGRGTDGRGGGKEGLEGRVSCCSKLDRDCDLFQQLAQQRD